MAVLALWIPDSHAWQLVLSCFLVLGLISGLLLLNATAMRRLRLAAAGMPLWAGALLAGAWLLLGIILFHLAGLAAPGVETRSGFWNSQLPASMRHLLPYEHLVTLQESAIDACRWIFVPALLLPYAMETAACGLHTAALGRATRVVLSLRHWGVAIVALGVCAVLVPLLTAWHPLRSVSGEVVSAVLRLSIAGVLATVSVILLVATDAELLSLRESETPNVRA